MEWLERPSSLSQVQITRHVTQHQSNSWILSFAAAVNRLRKDTHQEAMIIKTYMFLRETMPHGLSDSLSHIGGNDLMDYLLCCKAETAPSRHKLGAQARKAFEKLETWMKGHANWQDAYAHAVADANREKGRTRRGKPKRGDGAFAPGLYTPAGLLAVIVLAYPEDRKFKDWIVQTLQIAWMLTPRDSLNVTEGFWMGINATNIYDVFSSEETYKAELDLAADYDIIFGPSFADCDRDLRPYLPDWALEWANSFRPQEDSDISSNSADQLVDGDTTCETSNIQDFIGTQDSPFIREDLCQMSRHLYPLAPAEDLSAESEMSADPDRNALGDWLFYHLAAIRDGTKSVLQAWCQQWSERMDSAETYQDQLVIQSLFLQSLRRLQNFRDCKDTLPSLDATLKRPAPLDTLYMLLDIYDQGLLPPSEKPIEDSTLQLFQNIPNFKIWKEANDCLALRARNDIVRRDLFRKLFEAQTTSLYRVSRGPFTSHFRHTLAFDAMRIWVELEVVTPPDGEQAITESLLQEDVIRSLRLSNWQLQYFLAHGTRDKQVLTYWQRRIYESKFNNTIGDGIRLADLSKLEPVVAMNPITNGTDEIRAIKEKWRSINNLFGMIKQPVATGSATPLPTTPLPTTPLPTTPPPTTPPPRTPLQVQASPNLRPRPSLFDIVPSEALGQDRVSAKASASPVRAPYSLSQQRIGKPDQIPPLMILEPNEFTGHSFHARKRSGSPLRNATTKTPRLGLRDDLEACKTSVQQITTSLESLMQDTEADRDKTRAEIQDLQQSCENITNHSEQRLQCIKQTIDSTVANSDRRFLSLEDKLDSYSTSLPTVVQFHMRPLVDDVASMKSDTLTSVESLLDTKVAPIAGELAEMKTQLESMDMLKTELAEMKSMRLQFAEVRSQLDLLLAKPTPVLGEPGFLARTCPAPDGLTQREYDARLMQAFWHYVLLLVNQEGSIGPEGVGQDEQALALTIRRFPDLNQTAIVIALRHFHMSAFNCPLNRNI